jgi:hypothetical protein
MWEVDGQVEHLAPRGVRGLTTLGEGNTLSMKTLSRFGGCQRTRDTKEASIHDRIID